MKVVAWMAIGCAVSMVAAIAAFGTDVGADVLAGMIAPFATTSGTWLLTERTYKRRPERLTPLMVKAFFAKLLFFGAYVAIMMTLGALHPVPFALSFTAYFIVLHLVEAASLRRLFAGEGSR